MNRQFHKISLIMLCVAAFSGTYVGYRYQNTSSKRPVDKYEEEIEQLHSSVDKDADGIDDQTDILYGTLSYVASEPRYKSKYYQGGYPDDGYGVCTDVVANAFRYAGYDLMVLVEEDIRDHPEDYDVNAADKNIDFRRVRNLAIYFRKNAKSLTTDISDTTEWQGGDIVIFQNHIGIISDRRNKNGVPYVIHHNGVWQTRYEQDILESRDDLIGHYRVSE